VILSTFFFYSILAKWIELDSKSPFVIIHSRSIALKRTIIWLFILSTTPPLITAKTAAFNTWYGDSLNSEVGLSVQQTHDRCYIIAGFISSIGSPDILVMKVDSLGDQIWTRTYGNSLGDRAYCVRECADSSYIVVGESERELGGNTITDVYLLKLHPNGDTIWTRKYGGDGWDHGYCVRELQNGGYIIVGGTTSIGAGGEDVYLLKVDPAGDTIWKKTYGGSSAQDGKCIQEIGDGGFIITGMSLSDSPDSEGVLLIKTDSVGNMIWQKIYGDIHCAGSSVLQAFDGGYVVCGHMADFGSVGWDVWLLKTDAWGDTVWTKHYGGYSEDWGYTVVETSDTCYFIAGHTWSYGAGLSDVYLIKTDVSGDTIWTRIFGGEGNEQGYSAQETADKGFIIVGSSETAFGMSDVYLIKTDSLGIVQFVKHLAMTDYYLVAYPNPFSEYCSISFQNTETASLNIYDILGRVVKSFTLPTTHSKIPIEIRWEGVDDANRKLPGGVYFINLEPGDYGATEKVLLLR
jgi:hypothetical protein